MAKLSISSSFLCIFFEKKTEKKAAGEVQQHYFSHDENDDMILDESELAAAFAQMEKDRPLWAETLPGYAGFMEEHKSD